MRTCYKILCVFLALTMAHQSARAAPNCHEKAVRDLKRLSPQGYAIYAATNPKQTFLEWLKCEDVQLELATAVHESVHHLTAERDAYPLITGENIPRIGETKTFFEPQKIAHRFDSTSGFVESYLKPDAASSAVYFRYLLDELNAYAHDLNTALKIISLTPPNREAYHRDGLAALMAFVATYVETARAQYPETWAELQKPSVKTAVVKLWAQAETTMSTSCTTPNIGFEAPSYLSRVCSSGVKQGLGLLLGRAPQCPKACLKGLDQAGANSFGVTR